MKRQRVFLLLLAASILLASCAPKLKLQMTRPGEMNLGGVSKIAILGFDTVPNCPGSKKYPVDEATVKLAEKCMTDVFYTLPFFAFSDLCLEPCMETCGVSKLGSRFDALVYGKVWWEISEEYNNVKGEVIPLVTSKKVSFICNRDKKGNPLYCERLVTIRTKDEYVQLPYRAVTASMMLSLSLYKLNADGMDGRIRKLTQVSEIATQQAMILNGELHLLEPDIVGKRAKKDQAATLKGHAPKGRSTRGGSLDTQTTSTTSPTSGSGKSGNSLEVLVEKTVGDLFKNLLPAPKTQNEQGEQASSTAQRPVETSLRTIPARLQLQVHAMNAIVRVLHERVAPHHEEFEISLPFGMDNAASNLIAANAYRGVVHYIIEKKLSSGYSDYCSLFFDMELESGAQEVVKRIHKDAFEKENRAAPPEKRKEYVELPAEEVKKEAREYLDARATDLYVLGLALESLGSYDQALEIYRHLFYNKRGLLMSQADDQDYADGIGRCLLALKMDKGLTKGQREKGAAIREAKL